MNLLDLHATSLKLNVRAHGRSVTLTDPSGNTYPVIALWNAVEHVLKLDVINGNPMGERSSIYIDRDSLQIRTNGIITGEISPAENWTVTGSPNAYAVSKTYVISIPKLDHQLPGVVLFLSEKRDGATAWTRPD